MNTSTLLQQILAPRNNHNTDHISVAIVGLGYVGLPLALTASKAGYNVVGYDLDKKKVARLQMLEAEGLTQEEAISLQSNEITFSHNPSVLERQDIYIICVPTPVNKEHLPDLSAVKDASRIVGETLTPGSLVIVESTINPGVSEETIIPILEKTSQSKAGKDFHYAYCPERINPGDTHYQTNNIPRVLGGLTKKSLEKALAFYENILDAPVKAMKSLKEAEAVKMIENAFRDINIAFVNELALAFEREGIDTVNVIEGASTKPFGFMAHYPGCGVGGHCIPVDPYYLIQYGKQFGFTHHLLITAREVNNSMPIHTVDLLEAALEEYDKKLAGRSIALLGLAYKKNISDLRESPATEIKHELERRGANVLCYDPHAPEASNTKSIKEALNRSSATIIATDHDEFCSLEPKDFLTSGTMIVIDGRNCLNKEVFDASPVIYRGIGR